MDVSKLITELSIAGENLEGESTGAGKACFDAIDLLLDYAVVPREPTEVMIMTQGRSRPDLARTETQRQCAEALNKAVRDSAVQIYKEMIAAA